MFLHDAWRFFFEFGRDMFSDGIQTFDDVIILKKVKEYGIESKFKEYGGLRSNQPDYPQGWRLYW